MQILVTFKTSFMFESRLVNTEVNFIIGSS